MPAGISARLRRRRAARELARRMAELDRLDREYGLGTMPSAVPARGRCRPCAATRVLPGMVAVALVIGFVALSPSESALESRRLLGFDRQRPVAVPPLNGASGSYAFLQTQEGSGEPVGYDPCRPIEVLVNPEGAPPNYDELVDTGLARTGAAAGLKFVRVGLTGDRDVHSPGAPRRRPILIMWASEDEVPGLAGEVAGLGGSVSVGRPGKLRYVTGQVTLDRDTYASFRDEDMSAAQAIMDHELGHLVGLGHVSDPSELMYDQGTHVTSYGPGDREGLARLGNVPC